MPEAYCSVQDIRKALNANAASSGTLTASDMPDQAISDSALEATAIVDAYLDGPYEIGVDTIPRIVMFWTRDIGAYLATLTWRRSKSPAPNDPVVLRYQQALMMLNAVAAGTITIPSPAGVSDQPTVVNRYNGTLFDSWQFDLYGNGQGTEGFPLQRDGDQVLWAGYPE